MNNRTASVIKLCLGTLALAAALAAAPAVAQENHHHHHTHRVVNEPQTPAQPPPCIHAQTSCL